MGHTTGDVMPIQPAVDRDRRGKGLHAGIRPGLKAAGPWLFGNDLAHRHPRPMPLVFVWAALIARRSPLRRIKPSASFCR